MLVEDLLGLDPAISKRDINAIKQHCGEFIRESGGSPLYKMLPSHYADFCKVKVRLQKKQDLVSEVFNKAFAQNFSNLKQRAVFASPTMPPAIDEGEAFFIFPIDGYKFLYSKEVKNLSEDYTDVINTLFESFEHNNTAASLMTDMFKHTYTGKNLEEGINAEAEIIIYSLPYYYAVRVATIEKYSTIIQ